ncbi:MAG: hypothetical protein MR991_03810 [Clostridiales bacterium]|nr:hypothetical protein [Clostridiales bacterium]MDD7034684.1 hypothetical protein [Bacillota bacterium]MDY2919687.1 hypothetical protein [Lentihominibacter sp.]
MTFSRKLLRIYDRKILSGEITFSQSGISKDDFTRLCTDSEFLMSRENFLKVSEKMKLTDEEREELLEYL